MNFTRHLELSLTMLGDLTSSEPSMSEANDSWRAQSWRATEPKGEGEFQKTESRIKQFKYLLDRQVEAIKAHGHDPKDYKYYEDLRMIGSIPHSGFGMGLERALAFLYNLKDVRMASLFPRDQKRVYP